MSSLVVEGNGSQMGRMDIVVNSITKTYGKVRALDSVNLKVPSGTVFGLLGPNGAGKTTLIRVLTALTRPDSGDATVAGHSILSEPMEVKRRIGWVAAEVILDDDLTAMENLWMQAKLQDMSEWRETALNLLKYFGLEERADSRVSTFSTGMRKKLEIALALLHRPAVIFMDEPTIGLDPGTRRMLWDLIKGVNREYGVTVLLTTHYIEEADALCQQLAIINKGRIVATGTPAELKSRVKGERIEIRGDAIDAKGIAGIEGVRDVKQDGDKMAVWVDSSEGTLPLILGKIDLKKLKGIDVLKPSLETVFLEITGSRIDEEPQMDIRKFYANIRRARQ